MLDQYETSRYLYCLQCGYNTEAKAGKEVNYQDTKSRQKF